VSAPRRLIISEAERRAREAANANVLSREEAQAIVNRTIGFSKAEAVTVTLDSNYQGNVRFAANQMSTSGGVANANVVVESAFGAKHAAVTTNDLSDESLRRTVEQSEVLARLAPDDPESMPPLGPQQYSSVPAWSDATANLTPDERARAALTALTPARDARDLAAAGYIVTTAQSNARGNKAGNFAYHRSTSANYTLTVRTADGTGSGWAGADDPDWSKISFADVSKRAIDKARLSRNPVAIEPGRYTVILEPQAVDSRVTIVSDPTDPDLLAQPYDGDGLPLGRQTWIENGVLKQLYYSRFWAKKQGTTATGFPSSVKMLGGTATTDDMIRSTPRGVLVTRLWYLREVDPRTVLYTGLTRDGTFLIENGKIAKAIRNLRFNESPLFMLNNLEMLGRPMRVAGTEAGGAVVMPSIKVRDFNFTSLSEAV
jgi:predicted Zn-dependent protease